MCTSSNRRRSWLADQKEEELRRQEKIEALTDELEAKTKSLKTLKATYKSELDAVFEELQGELGTIKKKNDQDIFVMQENQRSLVG